MFDVDELVVRYSRSRVLTTTRASDSRVRHNSRSPLAASPSSSTSSSPSPHRKISATHSPSHSPSSSKSYSPRYLSIPPMPTYLWQICVLLTARVSYPTASDLCLFAYLLCLIFAIFCFDKVIFCSCYLTYSSNSSSSLGHNICIYSYWLHLPDSHAWCICFWYLHFYWHFPTQISVFHVILRSALHSLYYFSRLAF